MAPDHHQFGSARPQDIVSYISAHGWSIDEDQPVWTRGNTQVWVNRSNQGELLVPLRPGFGDYSLLVANVCAALAPEHATDAVGMLRRITAVGFDTIRLRVRSAADVDTLAFGDAVTLLRATRAMISAAAASAIAPRPTHPPRRPSRVEAYLRRLRMAQTEQGSFVVAILSPVDAPAELDMQQQMQLPVAQNEGEDLPAGRAAFDGGTGRTMALSLFAAVQAARDAIPVLQRRDYGRFTEVVHLGVSSNLYGALADLAHLGEATLELSIAWSPRVPLPPDEEDRLSTVLELTGTLRGWFIEGEKRLRSLTSLDPIQVRGQVTELRREPAALLGEALVQTNVAGTTQTVRLVLSPQDYEMAIAAHDRRQALSCSGIARKQGRHLVIELPSDLRIVDG